MAAVPTIQISGSRSDSATTTGTHSQPPVATPAFRAFVSRLNSNVREGFSQCRPWSELVDRTAMAQPESATEAYSRIRKNFSYFRVNYIALVAFSLAVSLVLHPISLLVLIGLLAAWVFLFLFRPLDQPLVIFERTLSDRETLGILVVLTLLVIFLTNVGSLLISALMVGLAIVCTHGAFRVPEDLFLDDQEPSNVGILSFLGGTASSVVSAAAPSFAPRV